MSVWESIDELLDDDNALTTTSNTINSSHTTKESLLVTNKDQLMNEDELDQDELLGLIGDERNDDFWNDEQVDAVEIDINEQIDEPLVDTLPMTETEPKYVESVVEQPMNERAETAGESSKENDSQVNVVKSEKVFKSESVSEQQKTARIENHSKSHNLDNSLTNQMNRKMNKNKFVQSSAQGYANKGQYDASNKRNENSNNRNALTNQTLPYAKLSNPSEQGAGNVQTRKSFPSATVPSVSSSTSFNQSQTNISMVSSSSISNPNQPFLFNNLPSNGPMNVPNTALMSAPFMNTNSVTFQPHFQQTVPSQLAPMPQYSSMNIVSPMGLGQSSQGLLGHPPQSFMHNPLQTSRDFLQPQYNPYNRNSMGNANNGGAFMNNQAAMMAQNPLLQPLMNNSSPINNGNKHLPESYTSPPSFPYSSSNGSNGNMMINKQQQQQAAPVISQMNPNQLKPNSIYINPSFSKKNSFEPTNQQHEPQHPIEKQSSNSLPVEKRDEEATAKKKPKKDRKELEMLLEKRLAAELAEEKKHENENASSSKTSSVSSSTLYSAPTKRKSDQSRNDQVSTHRAHETASNNDGQKSKKYERDERRDEQDEAKRKRLSQTPTSKPVATSQSKTNESKPNKEISRKPAAIHRKEAEVKVEKEPKLESLFVDDEYARKLEEQKRKREQILREKEEKRNQRINELKIGQKDASNTITNVNPVIQRKLELKEQIKEVEPKKIVKTIGNRFKKTF